MLSFVPDAVITENPPVTVLAKQERKEMESHHHASI